ncbi:hypothetical protein [Bradyrhizobium sp. CCBAU 45389]|uniref:hypothetical protein n=1 Tax=Bradyrhizobium sp. CCBAU 45389 TaxID=858429 RepID=UPI0023054B87|nr:hypothetical protein [Bradyrhizobium sp. CCBAU 45389]
MRGDSQKAFNLARDNRVSLAIDDDPSLVREITGLSIAAHADVNDPLEWEKAMHLLFQRYPQQKSMPDPLPTPANVLIFRLTPMVISLLDYSKGFGHAELITC